MKKSIKKLAPKNIQNTKTIKGGNGSYAFVKFEANGNVVTGNTDITN